MTPNPSLNRTPLGGAYAPSLGSPVSLFRRHLLKLSLNRYASFLYIILALAPLGIFAALINAIGGVSQVTRATDAYTVFLVQSATVGLITVLIAVICFGDRTRTRGFKGALFVVSLLLAFGVAFALSWVTALFYLMPSCALWLAYRRTPSVPRAA
jgi:hypothetical protein